MTQQQAGYSAEMDQVEDIAETTTEKIADATESAQQLADKTAEHARQYAEKAQDAARNVRPFVERSLREQPMTTLAAAAVIAFVLGALWKR